MNKEKIGKMKRRGFILCLFFVIATLGAFAQQRTVTGTVTDESGDPLPGVTVVVKGTTQGTVTTDNGSYTLSNVPQRATLVFSFVGMRTQEVAAGSQNTINTTMEQETIGLEEVVAVGYGTMKKSDLTGSVESIDMNDIPPTANISLTQSLQGYAAGLNVQGGSGAGTEPSISIRGQTTLSASTRPLIVLDGIIFNGAISDINVADVERVDILKDASAAAIYGSRSANGVMLITTKKGRRGEPAINLNTYFGYQDYTNHPVTFMNADQYAMKLVDYNYMQSLYNWYRKMPTGANDQGGKPVYPTITDEVVLGVLKSEEERKNYLAGNEVDWIDEVTKLAPMSNYDLSISGAGEHHNYYLSGSYTDQDGVLVGDDFSRITLTSKIEGDVLDWITLGLNTSFSHRDFSGISANMESARQATPLGSIVDEEGNYPIKYNEEFLMAHPLRGKNMDNSEIRKNLFYTAYAQVDIPYIEGLTYDFNYSNNYSRYTDKTFSSQNSIRRRNSSWKSNDSKL